ncbi:MAG: GNAT family N-acetyltransferase [Flavobacteriaceae bacterium]
MDNSKTHQHAISGKQTELMIQRIDHTNIYVAKAIYDIFQVSYAVEAELLNTTNFPPLQRQTHEFLTSLNSFYGYYINDVLVAVTEIKPHDSSTHIQSLVVHPEYFKQGIAQKLISFVFDSYNSKLFTVETGKDNFPACQLYQKVGFLKTKTWLTEHDIMKVRFEKLIKR